MGLKGVVIVVAIILILEGAMALASTKWIISLTKKLVKNQNLLRTFGFLELLVGLALLLFAINQ
jgi:uncharacterized protein YjeT (DUF2065 family)